MRYGYPNINGATTANLVCKSTGQAQLAIPKGAKVAWIQADPSNDCFVRGGGASVVADANGAPLVHGSGLNPFEITDCTKLIGYTAGADTTVKVLFGGC